MCIVVCRTCMCGACRLLALSAHAGPNPCSSMMPAGSSPGISAALRKSGKLGRATSGGSPPVSGRLSESSGPPFPLPPGHIQFPPTPPLPSPCWLEHLTKHFDNNFNIQPLAAAPDALVDSPVAARGRAERLGVSRQLPLLLAAARTQLTPVLRCRGGPYR